MQAQRCSLRTAPSNPRSVDDHDQDDGVGPRIAICYDMVDASGLMIEGVAVHGGNNAAAVKKGYRLCTKNACSVDAMLAFMEEMLVI